MKLLTSLAALALSAAPALAGGYYGHAGYGDGYYGGGETVVVTTRRVIHHAPANPMPLKAAVQRRAHPRVC